MSPTQHTNRPVRLDLGCGTAKCPGFIGADRFRLSGVDLIVDLDMPLPFRSDSVDVVVMSHSLEHVRDLLTTLKEVYRVCRHGARVCVVAPYSHQALNLANPFHKQSFNEHTPRFWTDSPHTLVDPSEFAHPHAPVWGLSRSDHDDPGIDFRCVAMEFFYFPAYRNVPPDERRAARKKFLDVCDQIMYQLVVVKKDVGEGELHELTQRTPCYEPPTVSVRKRDERIEALEAAVTLERTQAAAAREELAATASRLEEIDAELRDARQRLLGAGEEAAISRQRLEETSGELAAARRQLAEAEERWSATVKRLEDRDDQLAGVQELLVSAREEVASTREQLGRAVTALNEARAQIVEAREETAATREQLGRAGTALNEARAQIVQAREETRASESRASEAEARAGKIAQHLDAMEAELNRWRLSAHGLRMELAPLRSRRLLRLLTRFRPGPDLLSQMNPAFRDLLDDSYLFFGDLRGYRLQPSEDLQPPRAFAYPLSLDRPNLSGVMLAPILDLPDETGALELELAAADGRILARAQVALSTMNSYAPVRFTFPPVSESAQRIVLRVAVADAAGPVRLFEWRKRRWFGLRPLAIRPFCAFNFAAA
ncbi:MAG TPA: methyltransferase domain-containing protein [Candidatus Methylomirabilis sp.]|nr:methyltransferase domain-containing protein [Candidatus Methylomirabilis sp.]